MALNIVIESNIPYIRGAFDSVASVRYLAPEEITPEAMRTADALITRTRVRCDERLLAGSRCRLVASATIGLDHVDREWCEANGITVRNAPGCNAPAVAQYVLASLMQLHGPDLSGMTLGIVGVGNVGRVVERWALGLGMNVMRCDPPRAEAEGPEGFYSLEELAARADAITFHTPLTRNGSCPTFHLADDAFFSSLRGDRIIINSARGAVVDNDALLRALHDGRVAHAVVDCWEGEPAISLPLLQAADIATPHIAGYSRQGKIRATAMAVDAVASFFGIAPAPIGAPVPPDAPATVTPRQILDTYSPAADTAALRARPDAFEELRNHYALREEPTAPTSAAEPAITGIK